MFRFAFAALLSAGLLALPASGHAETLLYATGFEAPTFQLGPVGDAYGLPLSGQDGWRAAPREAYSVAPSPWVTVGSDRPYSGTHSLQLTQNAQTFGTVGAWRDLSPGGVVLNSPTDPFRLEMKLYLEQAPTSDLPWSLSLSTGGSYALGLTFLPDNRVLYGHTLMNAGSFYTPGFDLKNTWLSVAIERDPLDYTALRLSIDGRGQSWQQVVTSPGVTMPIVAFGASMPTFPVAPYGTAYIDDFRLGYNLQPVPEPGSWALWLAGLLVIGGLRRRLSAPT